MRQALVALLGDFLSAILFLLFYLATGSIGIAAGVALAVGVAQLAYLRLSGRRIEPMQWISLGLVVVLSGAAMLTQSPRFIMVKPTIAHFAIAGAMLRRGWMIRYLPEVVRQNVPEPVIVIAGFAWAGLLVALGIINLVLAFHADIAIWAWFITVGAIGAKVAALALQFVIFGMMIRRRRASA